MWMLIIIASLVLCLMFVFGFLCGAILSTGARYDERLRELLDDEEIIR